MKDLDGEVLSNFYPGVQDKIRTINRSPTVFTTKLLDSVSVAPGKMTQLQKFQLVGVVRVVNIFIVTFIILVCS